MRLALLLSAWDVWGEDGSGFVTNPSTPELELQSLRQYHTGRVLELHVLKFWCWRYLERVTLSLLFEASPASYLFTGFYVELTSVLMAACFTPIFGCRLRCY